MPEIFLVQVLLAVNKFLSVLETKNCFIYNTWRGIKELHDITCGLLAEKTKCHLSIAALARGSYQGFRIHIIVVDICRQVRIE
jgi:hypothetical protein